LRGEKEFRDRSKTSKAYEERRHDGRSKNSISQGENLRRRKI